MNIIELTKLTDWKTVKKAIKYHYPNDKNDYEQVFNKIKKFKLKEVEKDEFLEIEVVSDSIIDKTPYKNQYYDVCLRKKSENQLYSISFVKWSEASNYCISEETLKNNKIEEIIAHFIWEITFYGNEEQMKKTQKELLKQTKEAKNFISQEDFEKELDILGNNVWSEKNKVIKK